MTRFAPFALFRIRPSPHLSSPAIWAPAAHAQRLFFHVPEVHRQLPLDRSPGRRCFPAYPEPLFQGGSTIGKHRKGVSRHRSLCLRRGVPRG